MGQKPRNNFAKSVPQSYTKQKKFIDLSSCIFVAVFRLENKK